MTLGKYISSVGISDCYRNDENSSHQNLRKIALVLTALIPLFLLFSRVVADAALTIVGISFLVHSIKTKNYHYLKHPMTITLIALWLWFVISSFFSPFDYTAAIAISFVFVRFVLFFLACTYWLFTEKAAFKFAATIITLTIIIVTADALFQFITGFSISGREQWGDRLTSFLRRPDIGIYLAKLIFPIIAFWVWFESRVPYKRNWAYSFFLLFFVITIIFLTGERTATVLALSALVFALFVIGITNEALRIYMITGILGTVGIFFLVIYKSNFIYLRALNFIEDVTHFPDSLYGQLFKASIFSWEKYGIFAGVGVRQFRNSCPYFKESALVTYCDLHSHNIYLEILSESGLIGLCLFVIFVGLCLKEVWQSASSGYHNLSRFISSVLAFSGLYVILFPISVTMSFHANWSATLNWLGISLCIAILRLNRFK